MEPSERALTPNAPWESRGEPKIRRTPELGVAAGYRRREQRHARGPPSVSCIVEGIMVPCMHVEKQTSAHRNLRPALHSIHMGPRPRFAAAAMRKATLAVAARSFCGAAAFTCGLEAGAAVVFRVGAS